VFDTWGGVLSPAMYREFSLPYLAAHRARTSTRRRERTPLILFGKGNKHHVPRELAAAAARRPRRRLGP
jgi:uroporphyrinogen decarboxylase